MAAPRPPNLIHFLMRLRHARPWPAFEARKHFSFQWHGKAGGVEIAVRHYGDSTDEAIKTSPFTWRISPWQPTPQMLGAVFVVDADAPFAVDLTGFSSRAREGDTDIICSGWSEAKADWLPETLQVSAYATASALSIELDDYLEIVGIDRMIDERNRRTRRNFRLKAAKTIPDPIASASTAIEQAMVRQLDRTWWSNNRGRVFKRACARMMKANLLFDPVDRFIEYWLVSEFLSSHEQPRNKAYRIKRVLSTHLGQTSRSQMDFLYRALRIEALKDIRDDIAHGDTDEVSAEDLALMEAIANESIRYALGLPYVGQKAVDDAIASYRANDRG